ncbi:MAG: hypothetical protein JWO12_2118 [Frankiales bacterium]|nr:hypothetical protein [Frankiales bacterium]
MNEVVAGPSLAVGASELVAGAMALLLGLQLDPLALLLAVPTFVVLAGLGTRDLLLRPTVRASATSLTVVRGLGRITVDWEAVERVRVVTDRRTPLLEIDLGDTLVVLSRTRLGAPPYLVLAELDALRA